MDCQTLVNHLSAYIEGELDATLSDAAREHLSTCENCRVVLDSTQRTILLYRKRDQLEMIPAKRASALFDQIESAFKARK